MRARVKACIARNDQRPACHWKISALTRHRILRQQNADDGHICRARARSPPGVPRPVHELREHEFRRLEFGCFGEHCDGERHGAKGMPQDRDIVEHT